MFVNTEKEYVVATYLVHGHYNFYKKAQEIAVGLTVGTWTDLPKAQRLVEKHLWMRFKQLFSVKRLIKHLKTLLNFVRRSTNGVLYNSGHPKKNDYILRF